MCACVCDVCTCTYVRMCGYHYVRMYVCMCVQDRSVCMRTYVCVFMCTSENECVCVHMYICVCVLTHDLHLSVQNGDLLAQMEVILHNSRSDSSHLQTRLDAEKGRGHELEKEVASLQRELSAHEAAASQGKMENAQLRAEFDVVQGSLGGVEVSMVRATETIKSLQQVGVVYPVCVCVRVCVCACMRACMCVAIPYSSKFSRSKTSVIQPCTVSYRQHFRDSLLL